MGRWLLTKASFGIFYWSQPTADPQRLLLEVEGTSFSSKDDRGIDLNATIDGQSFVSVSLSAAV